jgi:pyruvate,water dikinase
MQDQAQADDPAADQTDLSRVTLCRLDEIEGTDLPLVGGKAFRLALLKQQGFNVPPGLVLTTHFFEAQIQAAKLVPLWAGSPDIAVTAEALSWLADALKTKPLSKTLMKTLSAQLDGVFGPDADSFAVRSSVIDEDHRDHTFAGVHLTELGVPRSAIPIAVTRCWASALSEPAIQYRQHHGMSIQGIRIAVLIQPMLSPQSSGVGFTINPISGARDELVVEAMWGLSSRLVSGEVQPYFYRLAAQAPDYPLIEQRAGDISPPSDQAGAAEEGPLSTQARVELAEQLERIQALLGEAQDVEWAWQDGRFFILQSRPVAVLAEPPPLLDQEWTRAHYAEFLPELPSPFFGSLLEGAQNRLLDCFKELGLELDRLGPYEKLILGRPYLNVSLIKRIMAQVGLTSYPFLQMLGYSRNSTSIPPKIFSLDWKTAWQARRVYWRVFQQMRRSQAELNRIQKLVDETQTLLAEVEPAGAAGWLKQLRQQENWYTQLAVAKLRLSLGLIALTGLGAQLLAPVSQAPMTTLGALASQGLHLAKDELNQALIILSQAAAGDPPSRAALLNAPADFALEGQNAAFPAEFQRGFGDLLAKYGQRAVYEADPGWPRYNDEPAVLLQIIQQYVKSEPWTKPAEPTPPLVDPPKGINRLFPWRYQGINLIVAWLRRLLGLRDELNNLQAQAAAACRQWGLGLGHKWFSQGWLEQPEDIFWLTVAEIERVFRVEAGVAATLSATVIARKETYQTYAQTQLPFTLKDSQLALIQLGVGFLAEAALATEATVGLPISPGQARGTVVVVRHPDEFEKIADEIILVMPSTDPAWLPLLHLAAGLIVETGGLLSHGSVIAREYGLPAVANIPQATQRFHTGDKVLVDGSTGVVQLLESQQFRLSQEE